jgi:aryl-alcohol dehydrogenase-like predicted oxidoreductase
LSGKYAKGIPSGSRATLPGYEWLRKNVITPENVEKAKQLEPVARDLGCTLAELALAWCLKNPNVSTVITGASRPEQVIENMKALEVTPKLDSGVLEKIEVILGNKPQQGQE